MQLLPEPPISLPEPSPADAIEQQASSVLAARRLYQSLHVKVAASRKAWELENAALLEATDLAKAQVADREAVLRALALTTYQVTGSKKPGRGTSIRTLKRAIYDPAAALAWAVERKLFVQLDVRPFETFAVGSPAQVPFVEIREEATATIATDLAAALAGVEVAP